VAENLAPETRARVLIDEQLPAPEIIAREIMENLESALTEFSAIVEALEAGKTP